MKALQSIMAFGQFEGLTPHSPGFRTLFTREALLESDCYRERLRTKQEQDARRSNRLLEHISSVRTDDATGEIEARLARAYQKTI